MDELQVSRDGQKVSGRRVTPHLDALAPSAVFIESDASIAAHTVAYARVTTETGLDRIGAHALADMGPVLLFEELLASTGDPLSDLAPELALPARGVSCRVGTLADARLALSDDAGEQGKGLGEKRVGTLRLLCARVGGREKRSVCREHVERPSRDGLA